MRQIESLEKRELLTNVLVADSVSEFSSTQGKNNWYYGYSIAPYGANAVAFSTYNSVGIGTNSWHLATGVGGFWTFIGQSLWHPNGANGNKGRVKTEQHAVRSWHSEVTGQIQIDMTYQLTNRGSTVLNILKNGALIKSVKPTSSSQTVSVTLPVVKNDKIYFELTPNGSDVNDGTDTKIKIYSVDSSPINSPITNPANGHKYQLLNTGSWSDAEAQAVKLGGHLVTINDQAEQNWVWSTFGATSPDGVLWMGLNDVAVEGKFVWTSGEPVNYTNWASGEPNNKWASGEDWGALWKKTGGRWNDFGAGSPEGAKHYAVVEIAGTKIAAAVNGDIPLILPWKSAQSIKVTQGYVGSDHTGYQVDFALPENTPVISTYRGTVYQVGDYAFNSSNGTGLTVIEQAGIYVKIKHVGTHSTWYSSYLHLKSRSVKVGDSVETGSLIGYSGNTGWSTGPHLHFHIRNGPDSTSSGFRPVPIAGIDILSGKTTINDFVVGSFYKAASSARPSKVLDNFVASGAGASVQIFQSNRVDSTDVISLIEDVL